MGRPVIYLHTEQSYYLNKPKVTIRDICFRILQRQECAG